MEASVFDILQQVWPDWKITNEIGSGTYGSVYKAVRKDYDVESCAAIKIISVPKSQSEINTLQAQGMTIGEIKAYLKSIVNEYINEIRLMIALEGNHNIVDVKDYKVVERRDRLGWEIFIRMELLTPFHSYIRNKKLSESDVIKLGYDICTALEICADKKIIHRDIKPGNILVNEKGDFKLGDFGVARKLENITNGLSQKYTPRYMAPEVVTSPHYDSRVDLYSLSIVLYEQLNKGRIPFQEGKQTPANIENAINRRNAGEAFPAPCEASPAMADLILRACDYNPDVRFASATEMKRALLRVANGTYKMDSRRSVQSSAESCDPTWSARKAPAALDQVSGPAVNTFGTMPKKKSKVPAVIVTVLAVILLVCAGIYAAPRVLDGNDSTDLSETAVKTTPESTEYFEFDEEQVASIISEAEALAAEEDYESALAKVQTGLVAYPKSAELQDKVDEYTEALNAQIKTKTLDEAKTLADSGDYVSAIVLIKNAQKTHGDSIDYQAALNTYSSAYKSEVIVSADALAENDDYVEALEVIKMAYEIIGEDVDLSLKLTEYENRYVDELIIDINTLIAEGNYEEATKRLSAALTNFPHNQNLLLEKEILSNSIPKSLYTVSPPYETRGCSLKNVKMSGETYTNAFILSGGWSDGKGGYAFFNLNGEYETLEFDIGHVDGSSMGEATLEIVLDGVTAQVIDMKPDDLPKHYTITLNGAKQMKIMQSYTSADYAIVNAVLYPSEIPKDEDTKLSANSVFLLTVSPPYETRGCSLKNAKMGGETYTNAFILSGGWSDGKGGYAFFNLNGEYETLEFDIGHVDGSSMGEATLEIVLDGVTAQVIDMKPDDLPKHYTITLNGAKQMKIVQSYTSADYAIANAVLN